MPESDNNFGTGKARRARGRGIKDQVAEFRVPLFSDCEGGVSHGTRHLQWRQFTTRLNMGILNDDHLTFDISQKHRH